MNDLPLSVLELTLVEAGGKAGDTLAATVTTARRAEELGFRRMWLTEHHGTPIIASVSPPVLAASYAAATGTIRVGSGGVLVPNHAPLALAEQFLTLSALHPGRIDLGMGRGPGTFREPVIRALRRGAGIATDEEYREGVRAVLGFLGDETSLLPGVERPRPWLLVSSPAGAGLAAELGLPIAVAHHIRPQSTVEVVERYRAGFRPSRWGAEPYVIVAVRTICADSDAEAAVLGRPARVLTENIAKQDDTAPFPSVAEAAEHVFAPELEEGLAAYHAQQAEGSPETVARQLTAIAARTGADELMLETPVYDPAARARSYELTVKALRAS
ncbi:LLM class flavin-dependent oxidoreductase [Amycolatopsis samaneae]|uniref:LLM class flavin-dependent oxidoreductase n=1 Tax=Amycolatopsis samaneae TaxID=664691 RepID=A0ABW5GBN6_9PSEU